MGMNWNRAKNRIEPELSRAGHTILDPEGVDDQEIPPLPKHIPPLIVPKFANIRKEQNRIQSGGKLAMSLAMLSEARKDGQQKTVTNGKLATRTFGCKMCPYYGSTRCYHGIVPPAKHMNGICNDRLDEVMNYVEMSHTYSGKEAYRNEVLYKIVNQIILLESNLQDYKDAKFKKQSQTVEVSDDGTVTGGSLEDRKVTDIMFDEYEEKIMDQIMKLSSLYSNFVGEDIRLEKKIRSRLELQKGKGPQKISIQQFNQFLRGDSPNDKIESKTSKLLEQHAEPADKGKKGPYDPKNFAKNNPDKYISVDEDPDDDMSGETEEL